MNMQILATGKAWDEALGSFAGSDIYFSAAYHKSFESAMGRRAQAFFFYDSGKYFFLPMMLAEIEELELDGKYYDIETVYGYTGPLASHSDEAFLNKAWQEFERWANDNNVICMLVRLSPILGNEIYYKPEGLAKDRETVMVDLKSDFKAAYHQKLRNDITQSEKRGLKFMQLKGTAEFKDLYIADMQRMSANPFYFFDDAHFKFLGSLPDVKIFAATHQGQLVAAASFMEHGKMLHYHLSASNPEHELKGYAVKFLLDRVMALYAAKGFESLHLGGGRSAAADDSLLFFKKRFGGKILPFYLAKTIINKDKYNYISNVWESSYNRQRPNNYLQFYRIK